MCVYFTIVEAKQENVRSINELFSCCLYSSMYMSDLRVQLIFFSFFFLRLFLSRLAFIVKTSSYLYAA